MRFKDEPENGLVYDRKIGGLRITARIVGRGYRITVKDLENPKSKHNRVSRIMNEMEARVLATLAWTMGKLRIAQAVSDRFHKTGTVLKRRMPSIG